MNFSLIFHGSKMSQKLSEVIGIKYSEENKTSLKFIYEYILEVEMTDENNFKSILSEYGFSSVDTKDYRFWFDVDDVKNAKIRYSTGDNIKSLDLNQNVAEKIYDIFDEEADNLHNGIESNVISLNK